MIDFRPGNRSPSATNVVVVVVVLLLLLLLLLSDFRSAKSFSFHNRSSPNFAYRLVSGDNIIHNRTVTDLQVKS